MKTLNLISLICLTVGVAIMLVNRFWYAFPDWAIRTSGIVILVAIFVFVFTRIRMHLR